MKDFVLRVKKKTRAAYHANAISLLERGEQKWKLDDVRHFAAVDPLRRGEGWLAFNLPPEARPEDDETATRSKKA